MSLHGLLVCTPQFSPCALVPGANGGPDTEAIMLNSHLVELGLCS